MHVGVGADRTDLAVAVEADQRHVAGECRERGVVFALAAQALEQQGSAGSGMRSDATACAPSQLSLLASHED